jgi:single-stranded-DNA-specific exonuclease
MKHGYGLTPAIVEETAGLNPRPHVIITVDNGIASAPGVARAKELGMHVVVTDHHLPAEYDVDTPFVVNPNQRGCAFTSKALAGCGVAWYFVQAVRDYLLRMDVNVERLLPIVAIGTVADVVPLDANNRRLVEMGIERIRAGDCPPGISALAAVSAREQEQLTTTDIAFGLGPCINAAGRLATMDVGIECLLTDSPDVAQTLAQGLFETNTERKGVEAEMVNDAIGELISTIRPEQFSVSLYGDSWHAGVIGIVAGRIRELVNRPTFVMAPDSDGGFKGSGRSIPGFHLRDALDVVSKRHPGVLLKFGGHAMAAGLTIAPGTFETFSQAFEDVCREQLTEAMLERVLEVDGSLPDDLRNLETAEWMRTQMWGQAFPEPLFVDEFAVADYRRVGADRNHLQLTLAKGGKCYKAIRFRHGDEAVPDRIRAAYSLGINRWRGEESLQLMLQYLEAA